MRILLAALVLVGVAVSAAHQVQKPRAFTKHGEKWSIRYVQLVDRDDRNVATTFCPDHRVDIQKDIEGRELARTLVHEIMHALACDGSIANDQRWNNTGNSDDPDEGHTGIYWGSEELTGFIEENPEIIHFIESAGK